MRPLLSALLLLSAAIDVAPVHPAVIERGFSVSADAYAAGHRGTDLRADPGQRVLAPITGTVAFAGRVAGKDVIVCTDGERRVSLEPAVTTLAIGTRVIAGQAIGRIGRGGHCDGRCLHLGLRVDGAYVAPMHLHARLVPERWEESPPANDPIRRDGSGTRGSSPRRHD